MYLTELETITDQFGDILEEIETSGKGTISLSNFLKLNELYRHLTTMCKGIKEARENKKEYWRFWH